MNLSEIVWRLCCCGKMKRRTPTITSRGAWWTRHPTCQVSSTWIVNAYLTSCLQENCLSTLQNNHWRTTFLSGGTLFCFSFRSVCFFSFFVFVCLIDLFVQYEWLICVLLYVANFGLQHPTLPQIYRLPLPMTHGQTHAVTNNCACTMFSPRLWWAPYHQRTLCSLAKRVCTNLWVPSSAIFFFCFSSQARVSSFWKEMFGPTSRTISLEANAENRSVPSRDHKSSSLSLSQTPLLNPSPSSRTIANVKQLFPPINPLCGCLCTFSPSPTLASLQTSWVAAVHL